MTITLNPEHEQLVARAIETGAYASPVDMIGRALDVLRLEDEWREQNRTDVGRRIERAMAQFDRGEFFTPEESKRDMARRKAEWLGSQIG